MENALGENYTHNNFPFLEHFNISHRYTESPKFVYARG